MFWEGEVREGIVPRVHVTAVDGSAPRFRRTKNGLVFPMGAAKAEPGGRR